MKGVTGWKRIWLQALEAVYIWKRDGEPEGQGSPKVVRSRRVEEQPRCGSEGRTPDEDHRSGYLDVTMM